MLTLFWLLIGAGVAVFAVYASRLFKKPLKWWDWAWFVVDVLFLVVTLAFVLGSIDEGETRAAMRGALIFGLPTLILIVPLVRRWVKLS